MGQTDIPLNELGRDQAMKAADRLSSIEVHSIYTSDLKRASETAQIIARPHMLDPIEEPNLREIHLGEFQGLTTSEVRERYPEAGRIPEGTHIEDLKQSGIKESRAQLFKRAASIFDEIATTHFDDTLIIVTHGGVLRCLLNHVLQSNSNYHGDIFYSYAINFYNCSISLVESTRENRFEIGFLNDYSHLDGLETRFE